MGFGWSVSDIIAISGLAIRVYLAYKDAPDGYSHISDEVGALQILINKVAQLSKRTAISSDDHDYGQRVLSCCKSILEGLDSLIEKYRSLVSTNRRLPFISVKLGPGKENIEALRIRLTSNAVLLKGFVRRFVFPCILLFF